MPSMKRGLKVAEIMPCVVSVRINSMKRGLKVVCPCGSLQDVSLMLNEKRIESLWWLWWDTGIALCHLNEKRIESRKRLPNLFNALTSFSMKRGLKDACFFYVFSLATLIAQWKEDWKIVCPKWNIKTLDFDSMKRGLKVVHTPVHSVIGYQ